MLHDFRGTDLGELYKQIRSGLIHSGKEVKPRGMRTAELMPAHIELTNPRARLAYHEDRKFNIMFAIAEAVSLFGGSNLVGPLAYYNERVAQYSDNGTTFHGSYGYRLAETIDSVVEKLKQDKDTRQAVLPILKSTDMLIDTKDVPCTMAIHFMIRDNKLHECVYMRSNDFFWGLPYDLFVFTVLQEVMANELQLELGSYHHFDTSLHVYEPHFEMLERIREMEPIELTVPHDVNGMRTLYREMLAVQSDKAIAIAPGSDFSIMFHNDLMFRRSQDGRYNFSMWDTPEWAKPFVKRWYKR